MSSPAGRKRCNVAHDAILEATHALLLEVGFEKLTIEGVATRAGVGKATIYRWWSSKGELAVEAFLSAISRKVAFPVTASARDDIAEQHRRVARAYRGNTGRIVREIIATGQFDPTTRQQFFEGYLVPRRAAAFEALERGVRQGEFRPGLDFEAVVDALYAPIFHRLLIGHAANDPEFLRFISDLVLDGISAVPVSRAHVRSAS